MFIKKKQRIGVMKLGLKVSECSNSQWLFEKDENGLFDGKRKTKNGKEKSQKLKMFIFSNYRVLQSS